MHIALATCRDLPRLDPDEALLVAALDRLGHRTTAVVWDDPSVRYSDFDACLIRSTWDYTEKRDAFVAWAERVAASTKLFNDARTVEWNTDKRYLRGLERAGISVVPTAWATRGGRSDLAAIVRERGWDEIVIKPAVSAGARRTIRTRDLDQAAAHLASITDGGDAMIQPYLPSVEGVGERSLVFFEKEFSHAIRKHAALTLGPRHGGEAAVRPSDDEIAFARSVLSSVLGDPLYARVDIVGGDGALPLSVMELELVEPSLFFAQSPGSEDVLARALIARAAR